MTCDVAIIGAGPAGLMAACSAAEKGLRVLLLEKFNDISRIRRACCQQFVMDENYESENIRVEAGRIVFPANGFEVAYGGPTHAITDTYFTSPGGHAVHFSYPDKRPIAIKFDKGLLLQGLLEKCLQAGVEYQPETLVTTAVDRGDHVEISLSRRRTKKTITAKKIIAADGVNSRTVQSLGMNEGRPCFATALCIIYSLEGVREFEPAAMRWHMGRAYHSFGPVILDPSLRGDAIADLVVMGSAQLRPEQIFKDFTTRGPCARMYEQSRVVSITGCTVKAYPSLMTPHKGNCLAIGDAAAYVEVEVQGGLMCGYHAAAAVAGELEGRAGFDRYTQWWRKSFEFNSEQALRVAQGYALVPAYEDDEIDYLFGLVEGRVLDGAYGQYKAPRLMWDAIFEHRDRIARERPGLHKKIKNISQATLADTFKG
ncbi:MAG: NAD(P)/FAD-dependent oxidoreductase [Deltaproteobacteria bacterium]|nr:NAD(P)/FAD-dependent oxidoreductase [Deltaproteobacteria bacterium]